MLPFFDWQSPGPAGDAFAARPSYRRESTGQPVRLATLTGPFTLTRLATGFGRPALARDVTVLPPWQDVHRIRPAPPRPSGSSDPGEFRDRLAATVAAAAEGHECLAVAASGGLACAALLGVTAELCRRSDRRLLVVTLDLTDDLGRRNPPTVAQLMEQLGVPGELVVVDARPSRWPDPPWTPHGPRVETWPRYQVGLARCAQDRGATLLLHGQGADQLLQAPPYLGTELVGDRDWRSLQQYRRDWPTPMVIELLAAAGPLTGPVTASAYWSRTWPDSPGERAAAVLAPTYAHRARRWWADFQRECLQLSVAQRASWAQATLMHRLFPYDLPWPAGDIAVRAPLLEPAFARYAYHLPARSRYSADQPSSFLRRRGLLAGLLPPGRTAPLTAGRRFAKALRRYLQSVAREPRHSVALGLLPPDWRPGCQHALDLVTVFNCENWIEGALQRGYPVGH
ncbi:MAG TPA: asparagine synthase-related protein [Pseudonocardiaceae bacterium]|nr:asparagine synthase-related protein [Pseudonocardiaceae bacterium]